MNTKPRTNTAWCCLIFLMTIPVLFAAEPGEPVPLEPKARLAVRQRKQFQAAQNQKAFHQFRFTDATEASGITFRSQSVEDVGKYNKPIHYDHGVGLAVADVDGDGLLDLYFVNQLGGNELWRNQGKGKFSNITAQSGVALKERICVAAAFADIDNDGDPDLFVTTVRGGNALFENTGKGTFKDISREAGLDYSGHSSGIVFFDYDRDGLVDLFVCNVGKFTTDKRGAGGYFIGVEEGFYSHLKPELSEASLLYRNLGNRKFQKLSAEVLNHSAWTGDASFSDVNGDGFPDLYVLNMQGDDHFYLNQNGKKFEKTTKFFPRTPWGAMGIKFFDFNNDQEIDLYLTDMHSDMTNKQIEEQTGPRPGSEKVKSDKYCTVEWSEEYLQGASNNIFGNALWKKTGTQFREISDEMGAETWWPWGPSVGDLNADGFADVFITSGMGYPFPYSPNNLLLNEGGTRFIDSEFTLGVEPRLNGRTETIYFTLECAGPDKNHPGCQGASGTVRVAGTASSRSSVLLDLDEDGDLDLITNEMNDRPQVLLSDLTEKKKINFTKIRLTGTKSNRDGLGAVVKVFAGGTIQTQPQDGKSGYLSQSTLPLYFGLGEASKIDRIEILWPSGKKQTVDKDIPPGKLLSISEPKD